MEIIAHRGGLTHGRENSLASFDASAKLPQVTTIELDLRVTQDGVVVLSHDATLLRVFGSDVTIADHTYAGLQTYTQELPTLEEAIEVIGMRKVLLLDIKNDEPTEPMIAVIKDYLSKGWKSTDFIVSSRQSSQLLAFKAAFPDMPRAVIEPWSGVRASKMARIVNAQRLHINQFALWPGYVWLMRRKGYHIGAYYNVRNSWHIKVLKRFGLDSAITYFPEEFTT